MKTRSQKKYRRATSRKSKSKTRKQYGGVWNPFRSIGQSKFAKKATNMWPGSKHQVREVSPEEFSRMPISRPVSPSNNYNNYSNSIKNCDRIMNVSERRRCKSNAMNNAGYF